MTRKKQIIEAAMKLFAASGVRSVSTSMIVKSLGISNGVFFHHFKSKQALLDHLYFKCMVDVESKVVNNIYIQLPVVERIEIFLKSFIDWAIESPFMFEFVRMSIVDKLVSDDYRNEKDVLYINVIQLIEEAKANKVVKNVDTDILYYSVQGAVMSCLAYYIKNDLSISKDCFYKDMLKICWGIIGR